MGVFCYSYVTAELCYNILMNFCFHIIACVTFKILSLVVVDSKNWRKRLVAVGNEQKVMGAHYAIIKMQAKLGKR